MLGTPGRTSYLLQEVNKLVSNSLHLTRDHRTGLNLPFLVCFIYFFVNYFSSFDIKSTWMKKQMWLLLFVIVQVRNHNPWLHG